ncbi:hypothetical protein EPN52_05350 [bacterium]|nr:MAG: hypothetical protein EPN52_05350 [bacterium]
MPQVLLSETLLSSPDVVAVALQRVLERLAVMSRHGELSLSVPLAALHLPGVGDLSAPVVLALGESTRSGTEGSIPIRLKGRRSERLFPAFSGVLRIHAVAQRRADLTLDGHYTPPAGQLGALADATLLRSAARMSLRTFLDRLADEVARELETPEMLYSERSQVLPEPGSRVTYARSHERQAHPDRG